MNERILEAISKLKKAQDELEIKLKEIKHDIDDKGSLNMQKALFTVADDLARYTIKDGNWYYNGKDTGIQAEAHDGEDGKQGPQGIPGKNGKDGKDGKPGKDGKNGKDGRPGRDGKDGKDGKQGLPGRDGKDGIVPDLKIGKVEVSPEYGGAMAKLRPGKDNIMYLDLTLPRGPQGFTGFDGKDAKINGVNTLTIEAGDNIEVHQVNDTLVISGRAGSFELKVVDELPTDNISKSTMYFVPSSSAGTNNVYDEYVYVNKGTESSPQYAWELVGSTEIDLTNYVTNTDYAGYNKGGTIMLNSSYGTGISNGYLRSLTKTYDDYSNASEYLLIGKGTLENVITGKGLVSNTDYAGSNKAGVIRTNPDYGTSITSVGALISATKTYQQYKDTTTQNMFISKGTLENVITGKGLVSNTDYATSQKGGVIKCFNSDGLTINNGTLITATKTYAQYNSGGNWMFVGKGTLENVITGKELDLKQLSTFDSTKTQVLKNINGTLTWVDE